MYDIKNVKWIVIGLDTRNQQYLSDGRRVDVHQGMMFASKFEAAEYGQSLLKDNEIDRFITASVVIDLDVRDIYLNDIETHGFKNDKSNPFQLSLFK
jgi:hypothetical protein